MLEGKGWKRRHGSSSRGQLTPEKRPFLSSYVLMSVRRSKFEYILTLGWKYREGLLDSAWSRLDKIYRCCHRILGSVLNPESDSPGIFLWGPWNKNNMSWWEAAVNFSFMLISKEGKRGGIQSANELSLHSLGVQTHSNCLQPQSLYLPLVQHFQLEIRKIQIWSGAALLTSWPCLFPLSSRSYFSVSNLITVSHSSFALLFNCSVSRPTEKRFKKWRFLI